MFFSKDLKFYEGFKNAIKFQEKFFSFLNIIGFKLVAVSSSHYHEKTSHL